LTTARDGLGMQDGLRRLDLKDEQGLLVRGIRVKTAQEINGAAAAVGAIAERRELGSLNR
jgi:hypothetical protein